MDGAAPPLHGVWRQPGAEGYDAWHGGGSGSSPVWLGRFPFWQGAAAAVDMAAIKLQGAGAQVRQVRRLGSGWP